MLAKKYIRMSEYQGLMSAKPSRKHRKAYQRSEIKLVRELGRTTASSSSKARPPPQFEFGQSVLGSMDVGGNGRTARQPPSKNNAPCIIAVQLTSQGCPGWVWSGLP